MYGLGLWVPVRNCRPRAASLFGHRVGDACDDAGSTGTVMLFLQPTPSFLRRLPQCSAVAEALISVCVLVIRPNIGKIPDRRFCVPPSPEDKNSARELLQKFLSVRLFTFYCTELDRLDYRDKIFPSQRA